MNVATQTEWAAEVQSGRRFEFGSNWARFLELLDDSRIAAAEASLRDMLGTDSLKDRSFIDIGSGSGLFSLAARRLGARVHSFDYDEQSVACTSRLRERFFPLDPLWTVERQSVLSRDYIDSVGQFDVVYSWGVLHHTGAMWEALGNVARLVRPGGQLFVAIYNDQGRASRGWLKVKKLYVGVPARLRWLVLYPTFLRLWGPSMIRDLLKWRPGESWRNYSKSSLRGMDPWRDVVDWVGGYPFEVAKPEEILDLYRARGFELQRLVTCGGGLGCNEFVLKHHG